MAFSATEIANIANSALDFYFNRGGMFEQTIQAKPLLALLEKSKKTFPGGKSDISLAVRGAYGDGSGNDVVKGYTHSDTVSFFTPATNKRAAFPWREHHLGLTLTQTELKVDGISVVDTNGENTSEHSKRELTVLVGLLESKLSALGEQYARSMNALLWADGTSDAKALAGMQSILVADPSIGTCGGINRATAGNEFWRNRARTAAFGTKVTGTPSLSVYGGGAVTSNTADGGALLQVLQKEYLQLIRYGGKPDTAYAGSDLIDALMKERRSNGYYTMNGFSGSQDVSMGDIILPGGTKVQYDPSLDDLSLSKRMYWFDSKAINLMAMEGEWRKDHTPARPANQFVLYRSITSTGQLIATQMNSSLVLDIA